MFIAERIQAFIHALEMGRGARFLMMLAGVLVILGLTALYDLRAYHNFNSPEAMDAAQVARNVEEGRGFTTDFIRPFSIYLVQKHNHTASSGDVATTDAGNTAELDGHHPDLANAPLYPLVLAGLMRIWTPPWKVQMDKTFWSDNGRFMRYEPEFLISLFNQLLLFAVVVLTFLLAKKLFDAQAAWLAALLLIGSDLLWKFSVSGLSTMLLLVIFLGLVWCLVQAEEAGRGQSPNVRRLFFLAVAAGTLTGLGMLTRYSFGWLIVPVFVFFVLFGGTRRTGLAVSALLVFIAVVTPWIIRNLEISGTPFGTAGYAVMEGTSSFPGTRLMQSLHPELSLVYGVTPYLKKLIVNARYLIEGDLLQLAGGWLAVLFFAGLMLGLRNLAARRLRYFTMGCLGVFIVVQALGRTGLSDISPQMNDENLLALLTPLVVIFGVAFFLTLLNQMNVPSLMARYGVMALLVGLACLPLFSTLLLRVPTRAYPPYYPPDIQKISGWMQPDELTMSDVPWAVAWYGDRQCVWMTLNSQSEFYALNDYIKHVNALYLTLDTLNTRFFTDCLRGGAASWGNFVYKTVVNNQLPKGFPLRNFPVQTLVSGVYFTDRPRWNMQ